MATARQVAARALMGVFEGGGYSNLVLDGALKREDLSPRDRAFCTTLFYGVVERRLTLEYALSQYLRQPLTKLEPAVREVLFCAFYQLLYMPSIPEHAVVNESVSTVRALGAERVSGLVNGVLRAFLRQGKAFPLPKDKLRAKEVMYSIPGPLIQLWRRGYGEETAQVILEGSTTHPSFFIRVNTLRTTTEALCQCLEKEGVIVTPIMGLGTALLLNFSGPVTELKSFREGHFHVQDLSSQLCAAALGVKPGMRVLDVCAAPGGKSFTLAQEMENEGELVAGDLHASRLRLVEEGAARLGISILRTRTQDATHFCNQLGLFDRVLCDVVCSGYGILRRKPEIRYKLPKTIDGIWEIQYNILEVSSQYCKEGGRLLYSTCTLNPQENQQVVERFLATRSDFRLREPMVTRFPGQEGGDGFFWALLEKERHF